MLKRIDNKARETFELFVNPDQEAPYQSLYKLFRAAALAVVLVFAVNLFAIGKSNFGEWGDFFGGVLNPILTFLTFMGLLVTIVLQQTELRQSREEFKRSASALELQNKSIEKQSFESTFFQMLMLHNQIVNSIDLVKDTRETRGRDCFAVFYTRLTKIFREQQKERGARLTEEQLIALAYNAFWKDTQLELGHYFRYLFNIIRFVKESGFEPKPYIRLVRAQLSDQEMLLLFYNCLSPQGVAFKKLVEEFALLDNMPRIRLLEQRHQSLLASSSYGLQDHEAT